MIYSAFSHLTRSGLKDGHAPTFWPLLLLSALKPPRSSCPTVPPPPPTRRLRGSPRERSRPHCGAAVSTIRAIWPMVRALNLEISGIPMLPSCTTLYSTRAHSSLPKARNRGEGSNTWDLRHYLQLPKPSFLQASCNFCIGSQYGSFHKKGTLIQDPTSN